MTEPLYNDYSAMNALGRDISEEIGKALRPVLEKAISDGCNLNHLSLLAVDTVQARMCEYRLRYGMNKRREERGNR